MFTDPSENESGVAFNVAIIYVFPTDWPADVNRQYAAVEGANPQSELRFEGGYRGNGITLRVGVPPDAGLSTESPSSCLIVRLNVGIMYSGIMLFKIGTSGVSLQKSRS